MRLAHANRVIPIRSSGNLSHELKGLYSRVARRLGLDPSYVSQVARGECVSQVVEDGLREELTTIVRRVNEQSGPRKRAHNKGSNKKKETMQARPKPH
jgi:hypothetical protein